MAALKLSQTEYRGRVHFTKTIAGAGPYDLRITFCKFLEWKKIGMPAVLPMTMVTLNELYQLGIKDKEAFLEPLASNMKSWIISKKFSLSESLRNCWEQTASPSSCSPSIAILPQRRCSVYSVM